MTTKSTTIVKALMLINKRYGRLFNDKLIDGRRSIKVLGWDLEDYNNALNTFNSAGFTTTLINRTEKTYNWDGKERTRRILRLHIAE